MKKRMQALIAGGGLLVAVGIGALLVAGSASPATSESASPAPSPTASVEADGFAAGGLQDPAVREPEPVSDAVPTRVRIPRIGVDTSLEDLALGAGGELAAPVDADLAGWFAAGVAPGEVGPAIIAGHVDTATGPAVFARIAELSAGDEVLVSMSSGETLTFVVGGSTQSAKASFPTDEVYRNVPRPELRLITCAGTFDGSIGHYTDNLIVFASLRD